MDSRLAIPDEPIPDDDNAPMLGDMSLPGNQQSQQQQQQRRTTCNHPIASFFHVFFKALALADYLIMWFLLPNNFVLIFVTCVILLAVDFWTVKNITGRLLVGLRWWNDVKEDGTNEWHFESKEDVSSVDPVDSMVFWSALIATPIIWLVLAFMALFKPGWLMVALMALILSLANVVGYIKCKKDARRTVTTFLAQSYLNSMTNQQ